MQASLRLKASEMHGCFRVAYGQRTGTTFLHHVAEGSVYVTAAHVLKGAKAGDRVLFQKNEGSLPVTLRELHFHPDGDDVCVFTSDSIRVEKFEPLDGKAGTHMGDPVRFLGFPHGLGNSYPGQGFPTPLLRGALFSGVVEIKGKSLVILDGFNNPGFSGGPVYAFDEDGKARLFGVISGYRYEQQSHGGVYRRGEAGDEELVPDVYVKPNSGLIYCTVRAKLNDVMGLVEAFNILPD